MLMQTRGLGQWWPTDLRAFHTRGDGCKAREEDAASVYGYTMQRVCMSKQSSPCHRGHQTRARAAYLQQVAHPKRHLQQFLDAETAGDNHVIVLVLFDIYGCSTLAL